MSVDEAALSKATLCECPQCNCTLESQNMVIQEGKRYCSEACAEGHAKSKGCQHAGCQCA